MPESLEREYTCTNRLGCNVCSQDDTGWAVMYVVKMIQLYVYYTANHICHIWSHDDLSRFGGMNFKFFF